MGDDRSRGVGGRAALGVLPSASACDETSTAVVVKSVHPATVVTTVPAAHPAEADRERCAHPGLSAGPTRRAFPPPPASSSSRRSVEDDDAETRQAKRRHSGGQLTRVVTPLRGVSFLLCRALTTGANEQGGGGTAAGGDRWMNDRHHHRHPPGHERHQRRQRVRRRFSAADVSALLGKVNSIIFFSLPPRLLPFSL